MNRIVPSCSTFLVLLFAIFLFLPAGEGAAGLRDSLWVTDGPVHAMAAAGDYDGGPVGGGIVFDTATVLLDTAYPLVNGRVNAVIPDASGGWFIAGAFTQVGGIARNNIVRLKADKSVDMAWDPGANGEIRSLALSRDGATLYVGGDFTILGGMNRDRLAKLDSATGQVDGAWNPGSDNSVQVLVLSADGRRLYAGGGFTAIAGAPRSRLAALDADSGAAITGWDPGADGDVLDMTLSGDGAILYLGGDFLNVGGMARNRLAALHAASGAVDGGWDPGADATVRALGFSAGDGMLYIGGDFTFIGGEARNRIAAIATRAINGDRATAWNPDANGAVNSFVLSGDTLYVGGAFTTIAGQARNRLAALDTGVDSNNALPWAGGVDNTVAAMALAGEKLYIGGGFTSATDRSTLYIGGDFTYVGPATGGGIAINADPAAPANDQPDYAYPAVNGVVHAVLPDGAGGWYIGGQFSKVGNVSLNNIAHINNDLTVDSTWAPDADGPVRALALSGATLYAGGDFTRFAGGTITRNYLAALDTAATVTADIPTAWAPDADGPVRALALNGAILFAGGDFTAFAGGTIARNYLAALDTAATVAADIPTAWDPGADGMVRALALSGATLYVGGDFGSLKGVARSRLAALPAVPAMPLADTPTLWNPAAGGSVNALALSGASLYAGGSFVSVGGVMRSRLAALDLNTGQAKAWDPGADGAVRTMIRSASGASLYLGGDFSIVAGQPRSRAAEIDLASGLPTFWNPAADASVYTLLLSEDGTSIYAGGEFSVIGGQSRRRLAELRTNGTATIWAPELAGTSASIPTAGAVYALAQRGVTIYAGGDFAVAGNAAHRGIVALDSTTASPTAWAPQVAGVVRTMQLTDEGDILYIGGDFTAVGGDSRGSIAALSTVSNLATTWDPQADGEVLNLVLARDRASLYVGGAFDNIGGGMQPRLAALATADGQAIAGWGHQANALVRSLFLPGSGGTVYVAGDFTQVDGLSRGHLVALTALPLETDAPFTTATPAGGNYNGINNKPVVLTCDDGSGSGCAATYFTTDGSTPTTASDLYTEPLALVEDTVLKFFSVDRLGNTESVNAEQYFLELLAPVTTATPGTRVFSSRNLEVTLSCVDEASGCAQTFYTTNDDAPIAQFISYTGPIKISDNVTLRFYSTDQAGNVEVVRRENYVSNYGGTLSFWLLAAGGLLRFFQHTGGMRARE